MLVERDLTLPERAEREVVHRGVDIGLGHVDADDAAALGGDGEPLLRPSTGVVLDGGDAQDTFGEELGDDGRHGRRAESGVPGELLPGGRTVFEQSVENLEAVLAPEISGRAPRHRAPSVVCELQPQCAELRSARSGGAPHQQGETGPAWRDP